MNPKIEQKEFRIRGFVFSPLLHFDCVVTISIERNSDGNPIWYSRILSFQAPEQGIGIRRRLPGPSTVSIPSLYAHARQKQRHDLRRRLHVRLLHATRRSRPYRLGVPLRRDQQHHHIQMVRHSRTHRGSKQVHERAPHRPTGAVPLRPPARPRRGHLKLRPPLERLQNATKRVHVLFERQTPGQNSRPSGVQPDDPQHCALDPQKDAKFRQGDLLPVSLSATFQKRGLGHGWHVWQLSIWKRQEGAREKGGCGSKCWERGERDNCEIVEHHGVVDGERWRARFHIW